MSENQIWRLVGLLQSMFIHKREMAPFFGGLDLTPSKVYKSLANDGQWQPFTSIDQFAGLVVVHELTYGTVGLFLIGGGGIALVSQTGGTGIYTTTAGTPNKINVYALGGTVLSVQNKSGATITVTVTPIRTRTQA